MATIRYLHIGTRCEPGAWQTSGSVSQPKSECRMPANASAKRSFDRDTRAEPPLRLADSSDRHVPSAVTAQLAQLETELAGPLFDTASDKYSRRVRVLIFAGGAAGGWALLIGAVRLLIRL